MRRLLLLGLFASIVFLCGATQIGLPWPGPGAASGGLAYSPVDVFVNMNGTTTGTAVSGANLATGTVGTFSSWTAATSGETFQPSICPLVGSVTVNGGATYPASTATQSLVHDDTVAGQMSHLNISTSSTKVTVSGCINPNMTAGGFAFYDEVWLVNNNGNTAALQIVNQSPVVIRVEGAGGGEATTRSSNLNITLGTIYWFTMQADWTAGTPQAQFNLYTVSGTTYTLVGTRSVALVSTAPNSLQYMGQGNGENGANGGTTTFQNTMLDLSGVWPNIAH